MDAWKLIVYYCSCHVGTFEYSWDSEFELKLRYISVDNKFSWQENINYIEECMAQLKSHTSTLRYLKIFPARWFTQIRNIFYLKLRTSYTFCSLFYLLCFIKVYFSRLICLLSHCSDGLLSSDLSKIKKQFLQVRSLFLSVFSQVIIII